MRKDIYNWLFYVCATVLVLICISCERLFFEDEQASTNPQQILDYLWEECDEKYTYFDLKAVNWDRIHTEYSAKIYDGISDDSLFRVLGNMLNELKDGHVNLSSDLNISFYDIDGIGVDNFEWRTITDYYLPPDYYVSGPFSHDFLNNTNEEIGYIRFGSFPGSVDANNLGFVLERYKDTKGLILDLRENGGGAVRDVFSILNKFIAERTTVFYSRIKDGPEHNDFLDPEPSVVHPSTGTQYLKEVIMLVDRGTYSAGSFTSLAAKAIPNITLMGDTTGGGLGLPNGGQLPNGWRYRFSATQTLTLDLDESYENGVPPDIMASLDWEDLTTDEIIERAIIEILN